VKPETGLSLILAALLLLTLAAGCGPPLETATVTGVIDGDTIVIDTGQQVHYIGIDAPELREGVEDWGAEAWRVNRHLVEGKEVVLERDVSDTAADGSLLRYVYVDKVFVNAEMVRQGLAEASSAPPDVKNDRNLGGLEAIAREAGRGMWADK